MKINFDDTTTLCDEFSKTLNFIYFAENEYIKTCYINFNIQDFNEQTTIPTGSSQNALFSFFQDISGVFKTYPNIKYGALI